jgi:Zn-dependent M28 family amino/carboxypeptidase
MSELTQRLRSHLTQVARERDMYFATTGHFFVREYIRTQLAQWGDVVVQEFTRDGMTLQNLILNLPGLGHQPPIVVGAHYDSVPHSPGADDNATGIAVLLELARHFALSPARHPLRLIAFDLEETSYEKAGSTHYARSLGREPIRLMLSLEMLGYCDSSPNSQQYPIDLLRRFYPNQGDFIGLIGNLKALPDLLRLQRSMRRSGTRCECLPVPNRGQILPDTRRSDHAAFWDRGDRAVMVTDTAHLRNPHYHQPSDRLETVDLDFLTGVCHGLAVGLHNL